MLVNPSGAEPTECIYPRAAVAPLPDPGLKISQPLRGCRVLRLSEHGRATPSDTIYCIYLCTSPEGVELFIAPVCVSAASTDWGRQCNNEAAPKGLTSISDAHNHRGPHDCPHHASIVVAAPCAGLASKNKRIICNACNNPPLTVGTLVRASAPTSTPAVFGR